MAEEPENVENQEEAPSKDAEATPVAPKAAGASPWLPVLVVIIVLPILSLVVTEFVIIPRVHKAVEEIAQVQSESGHPAEGGALPTSHEPAKAEKSSGGGHGGGGHGAEGGASSAKAMEFESIVANLSGSMKTRFLKVSFTLESNLAEGSSIVKENRTKLIDATLGVLGSLTITDLEDPGMKNIVRNDLIDSYNHVLGQHVVDALFFSEFVIQ